MPERGDVPSPEPHKIVEQIARELGLDPYKKPTLEEQYPDKQHFPEEAPTADGRYIALSCLEQIYNLAVRHTTPGQPLLLSPGDVRWLHREFRHSVQEAWDLPEPFPDFTLTHLLGATKRQIAHLSELKRFHESDVFDPALDDYSQIAFVTERAILDGEPAGQCFHEDDQGWPTTDSTLLLAVRQHRQQVPLAPIHPFACIVAPRPPFSVVLTLWLSMLAALG